MFLAVLFVFVGVIRLQVHRIPSTGVAQPVMRRPPSRGNPLGCTGPVNKEVSLPLYGKQTVQRVMDALARLMITARLRGHTWHRSAGLARSSPYHDGVAD
jgi:hypothetical protein